MIFSVIIYIGIILIAIIIPFLTVYYGWRSYQDPVMGVKLALILFLINSFLPLPAIPLGVSIYFPDLLYLLLFAVGFFRFFSMTQFHLSHRLWIMMGVVFFGIFFLGLIKYKTLAGVEFRLLFPFWAGSLYLMTFKLDGKQVDKIVRMIVWTAAVMLPLICFRWLAMVAGLSMVHDWNEGGTSLRVVAASQTFFLAQAFLIAFYINLKGQGPKWWAFLIPVLFCCIVVLQHRSVWVVTLLSVLLIYFVLPEARRKILKQFGIGSVISIILIGPLLATGRLNVVSDSLEHSVEEVGSKKSTLMWRLQSAEELVGSWAHGGPIVLLIGKPFGAGFERYVELQKQTTTVAPHNHYVLTLLRGGVLGVTALVFTYIITLRQYIKKNISIGKYFESRLLAVLQLGQLVFFFSYQAADIEFVIVGLALALVTSTKLNNSL